jgi:hypothetical protein
MHVEEIAEGGVLEGSARVLREVLRTPRVRRTLQILRRELDPENAPLLVRALTEDQGEFLDVLALSPRLANAFVEGLHEVTVRLGAIPPEMLRKVARRLVAEVDAGKLGETLGRSLALAHGVSGPDLRGAARRLARDFASGVRRGAEAAGADPEEVVDDAVRSLCDGVRAVTEDHPRLATGVVKPLVDAAKGALGASAREGGGHDAR